MEWSLHLHHITMPHVAGKKRVTKRPFYHHYHLMENGRNKLSPPENTEKKSLWLLTLLAGSVAPSNQSGHLELGLEGMLRGRWVLFEFLNFVFPR